MIEPHEPIKAIVYGESATGKCLGRGTGVLLADGKVLPVEKITSGMELMGPDSLPRKVLSTNKGYGPLCRIVPVRSKSWVCNDIHVMTLMNHKGVIRDIPLDEHRHRYTGPNPPWRLFHVGIELPEQTTAVRPYLMGAWLGDGTYKRVEITCPDEEVLQEFLQEKFSNGVTTKRQQYNGKCASVVVTLPNCLGKKGVGQNTFLEEIRRATVTNEKRILPEYLLNSRENRFELLAGLIDTDGYLAGRRNYEILSVYGGLADDIVFLARSLGFMTRRTIKRIKGYDKDYHRIHISGEIDRIPVRVSRKKAIKHQINRNPIVEGFRVEDIGDGEFFGFSLSGDGRFLLEDFTVTHNTGALFSLLEDAYKVAMLDFDNGESLVRNMLVGHANAANFNPVTLLERTKMINGRIVATSAKTWVKAGDLMNESFKGNNGENWGPVEKWDSSYILVIDTLTAMSRACKNYILASNEKLSSILSGFEFMQLSYKVQTSILALLDYLLTLPCNVIINTHPIMAKKDGTAPTQAEKELAEREKRIIPLYGFPGSFGKSSSKDLSKSFSHVLYMAREGTSRTLWTVPKDGFLVKTSAPKIVKPSYPQERALAEYFKAVRGIGESK